MADTNSNMNFIDKLVDDQGIKTNVTVNLSPDIYIKLFLTILLSVSISVLGASLIKNAIKK
jgi:hypothetical protein